MASEKLNRRPVLGAFVDLMVGALVDLIVGALVDLTVGALVDLIVGAFVDFDDFNRRSLGAFVDLIVGALVDLTVGALVDLTVGALVDLTVGALVDLIVGAFVDFDDEPSIRCSACKKKSVEYFVSVYPGVFILDMHLKVFYLHRRFLQQIVVGAVPSLCGQHQLHIHRSPLLQAEFFAHSLVVVESQPRSSVRRSREQGRRWPQQTSARRQLWLLSFFCILFYLRGYSRLKTLLFHRKQEQEA
jgi:hypothetical protein